MTLGNAQDAQLIYRRRRTGFGPLPKGWKKLGAGAYRTCYLSPDRIVYKVCHEDEGHWTNHAEYIVFHRAKSNGVRLPKGWRIAKTHMYTLNEDGEDVYIIAMEYVEGKHVYLDRYDDDDAYFDKIGASKAYRLLGLYDLHEGNFLITPEGKKVIIDLGE